MASNWISYNELAWTEDLLADPADYEQEVNTYVQLINTTAGCPVSTVLHLGCGAGGHDRFFKEHYRITGVDLSAGMLEKAKTANPEVEYLEGDMRTIRPGKTFDAVIIPDSIDYLVSEKDLEQTLQNAALHLKPGGVLMIVAKTREIFRNNNFAYSGEKGDTHVTVFENNFIHPFVPDTYRITLVYLIRQKGELSTYIEETSAGLFPESKWYALFETTGFNMEQKPLNGLYDAFLLGDGDYPMIVFIGTKK